MENKYDELGKQVGKALIKIYGKSFYGKPSGRYRISKKQLKEISGLDTLDNKFIKNLRNFLMERGYVFVDIINNYVVLEKDPLHRYRKVTKEIISKIVTDKEKKSKRK